MSATYARSDYNDENLHCRDGSLLRKKREQWAKEKGWLNFLPFLRLFEKVANFWSLI